MFRTFISYSRKILKTVEIMLKIQQNYIFMFFFYVNVADLSTMPSTSLNTHALQKCLNISLLVPKLENKIIIKWFYLPYCKSTKRRTWIHTTQTNCVTEYKQTFGLKQLTNPDKWNRERANKWRIAVSKRRVCRASEYMFSGQCGHQTREHKHERPTLSAL